MTLQLSTTVRNAMLDAIETAVGTSAAGSVSIRGAAAIVLEDATMQAESVVSSENFGSANITLEDASLVSAGQLF